MIETALGGALTMKTREMINKDENTVNFANHFNTKQSIKNLLKKVPNAKKISPLFENPKYGKEILEYSNLNEQFDIILSDVFSIYTRQVADWRSTGDNRSTSARDEFFRDLVINRMKKAPGKEIAATLGDFMKSSTGKEIEKTLADAGIKEDDDLYLNIVVWIAARTFINNAMVVAEVVGNVEQQVEHAAHSSSSPKKEEIIEVTAKEEIPTEVEKVIEMVKDMEPNVSNDEINRFVSIVKPFVPMMIETFGKTLDKCNMTEEIWKSESVQSIVRSFNSFKNFSDRDKKLMAIICRESDDAPIIARSTFFIVLDLLRHPTDDKHLYEDAKFLIRLAKSEENTNALLEELINQSPRVSNIIAEIEESAKLFREATKKAQDAVTKITTPVETRPAVIEQDSTSTSKGTDDIYEAMRDAARCISKFSLSMVSKVIPSNV